MTQTSDDRTTTPAPRRSLPVLDLSGLERRLQAAAVQGEVRFVAASRAMYASDGSNFRQVPIGVVTPRSSPAASGCARRPRATFEQVKDSAWATLKGDEDRRDVVVEGVKTKVQEMLPHHRGSN